MELEAKSSLVAIFDQVGTCLSIMQSLRLTDRCIERGDRILDATQKSVYTRRANGRLLMVAMNSMIFFVGTSMAVLSVALSGHVKPSMLGVGLTSASTLYWALNSALRSYIQLETEAVAVDRLRRISALAPEEDIHVPESQVGAGADEKRLAVPEPQPGAPVLQVEELSLRYR